MRKSSITAYKNLQRVFRYYIDREGVELTAAEIMRIPAVKAYVKDVDKRLVVAKKIAGRIDIDHREIDSFETVLKLIYESIPTGASS